MHPILFSIGSFYIGTYGLMVALGMLAGAGVVLWLARREGLSSERVMDLIFFAAIAGIAGGRITYIVVYFSEFLRDPIAMILSREGFVFMGGMITSGLVAAALIRRYGLPFWKVADTFMTGLPLGHFFGRLGCFFAGCCYGRPVDPASPLAWLGVHFPARTVSGEVTYPGQAFAQHVHECGLNPAATASLPVWPTQLMESAGNLAIFLTLLLLWRRRRFNGQVFLAYLIAYPVMRFLIEFLRGDPRNGVGPLSTSQAISVVVMLAAVALWAPVARRQNLGRVAVESARAKKAERRESRRTRRRK